MGVVLVTGGAGGIGRACVQALYASGYKVCFSYLNNQDAAHELVSCLGDPLRVKAVQCDVRSKASVGDFFKAAQKMGGPLVGLVNNAGIAHTRKPFAQITPDELAITFETNVFGPFFACQEAVTYLNEGASIVNIGSQAGISGGYRLAAYAASKAALATLTLSLSKELADHKIRINAIAPGIIETDQNIFTDIHKQTLIQNIPLGRLGQGRDIAEAVLWLLSKQSDYMTGVTLPLTGGK
jgi:NAD(P)-dependent dehydrogenase (short-subunit alcohol dehydrogenase family)